MELKAARKHLLRADRAIAELASAAEFDIAEHAFLDAFTYLNAAVSTACDAVTAKSGGRPYATQMRAAMKGDELIDWARNARNSGLKDGRDSLEFAGAYVSEVIFFEEPRPGEQLRLDAGGVYFQSGDKAGERRTVDKKLFTGGYEAVVPSPPATHQGLPILDRSPLKLLEMVRTYVARLIDDVEAFLDA